MPSLGEHHSGVQDCPRKNERFTIVGGILFKVSNWAGDVGSFVNSLNAIASMFALGLPIFLLTGLMFASPTSRRYLQQLLNQGISNRKSLIFRFVQCLLLVGIYTIISTIIIFIVPFIFDIYFGYPASLNHFVYMPSALIASFIVGSVLTAIASLLALGTDNVYLSASLGSTTTIIVALVAGWTSYVLISSVTRNLASSSPHNLFKMLAAVLNSYDLSIETRDMMYFGFNISPESLLVSLFGYALLASAAIILALPILRVNMSRWRIFEMGDKSTIWWSSTAPQDPRVIENTRKDLRFQRGIAMFFVSLLLVSFSLGNVTIAQNIEDSSSVIHYKSPEGGESIALGVWLTIQCDISQPYPDLSNYLRYTISIDDWGSCPDELSYTHAVLMTDQNEFHQLNESSKLELCSEPRNRTKGEWGGLHVSWYLEDHVGTHIVVFYVYATTNSTLGGALQVTIEVYQQSR